MKICGTGGLEEGGYVDRYGDEVGLYSVLEVTL